MTFVGFASNDLREDRSQLPLTFAFSTTALRSTAECVRPNHKSLATSTDASPVRKSMSLFRRFNSGGHRQISKLKPTQIDDLRGHRSPILFFVCGEPRTRRCFFFWICHRGFKYPSPLRRIVTPRIKLRLELRTCGLLECAKFGVTGVVHVGGHDFPSRIRLQTFCKCFHMRSRIMAFRPRRSAPCVLESMN